MENKYTYGNRYFKSINKSYESRRQHAIKPDVGATSKLRNFAMKFYRLINP